MASVSIIDTTASVASFVDYVLSSTSSPSLYIDVEGVNLSRFGTVSILQIHVHPQGRTYLLDIHLLQQIVFTTPGNIHATKTLKYLLESSSIPKIFFDLRNDIDALHAHFAIKLQNVHDIQVLEAANRPHDNEFLKGLGTCILDDLNLSSDEKAAFATAKARGKTLFCPEQGGSFTVFNVRPMLPEIVEYCAGDVDFMPRLHALYLLRLGPGWAEKVEEATGERVEMAQMKGYQPTGIHKRYGPWSDLRFPGWFVKEGIYEPWRVNEAAKARVAKLAVEKEKVCTWDVWDDVSDLKNSWVVW